MALIALSFIVHKAQADDSLFLSPLEIWSESIVSKYSDETDELQIRIHQLTPKTWIQSYPLLELKVDRSKKFASGSLNKNSLMGRGYSELEFHIIKEGDWFNPYPIVQRVEGSDPLTGKNYILALDQWEAKNAFNALAVNRDDDRITLKNEDQDEVLLKLESPTTLDRIVLNALSSNSNYTADNEKEALSKAELRVDSKECTYRQFEVFSKWLRSSPKSKEVLGRLRTHFKSFSFKVLDYSAVTEENIKKVLALKNSSQTLTNQRYWPIENLNKFAELVVKHLNFGIRVFALETLMPDGSYKWSEREKKRVLSFNVALAGKESKIQEFIASSTQVSAVELSSGLLCVLNTPQKFEDFIEHTTNELSELIQYQQK